MAEITVTVLGRTVARSGLLPETAAYFLTYLDEEKEKLLDLLPQAIPIEAWAENLDYGEFDQSENDLAFVLSLLCFASPEYEETDTPPRRYLPYMFSGQRREGARVLRLQDVLAIKPWDQNIAAVNAAEIATNYTAGTPLVELENRFEGLSGGIIHNMMRDQASHLSGLADILEVFTIPSSAEEIDFAKTLAPNDDVRRSLKRLLRRVRQLARQAIAGVPEDVLWMRELQANGRPLLTRKTAMALREREITTLDDILDNGKKTKFHEAMNSVGVPNVERDVIRIAAEEARSQRTKYKKDRLLKEINECHNVIGEYFSSDGIEFENCLTSCFKCLEFGITDRDGDNGLDRFPDFVIEVVDGTPIVIECKSKENDSGVPLGAATDVGGKAAAHGLNRIPMVTVCQPYVSTDVPRKIKQAMDLSVVNAEDLAMAMAAVKRQKISKEKFHTWLTTPGQPRFDDLFRR